MSPRQQLQEKSLWIFTRTVRGCSARTVTLTFSWSESGVTVRLTLANPQDRRTAAELLRRVHVATAYAYQRVTGYAMPPYRAIGPS